MNSAVHHNARSADKQAHCAIRGEVDAPVTLNARERAVADVERCLAHWREMRDFMAENEPTNRVARRRWERKYGAPWTEMHTEAVEAVEMFETGLARIEAAS